jgi:hypothetical protein
MGNQESKPGKIRSLTPEAFAWFGIRNRSEKRASIYKNIILNLPESRPIFCLGWSALIASFFGFRAILKHKSSTQCSEAKRKKENSPWAAACSWTEATFAEMINVINVNNNLETLDRWRPVL